MKKILIAVPCMDTVHTAFCQSLLDLRHDGNVRVGMLSSALIYDARNKLAEIALTQDYDYILWLDSDMTFDADLLDRLIADDKDIVCPLFVRRREPFSPVLYKELRYNADDPTQNKHTEFDEFPRDELFEVEGCGFGCVLMKTDAIRQILVCDERTGLFAPLRGLGEDLSLCVRAREAGLSIWCDPRIKVGHIAQIVVNIDTYDGVQKARAER